MVPGPGSVPPVLPVIVILGGEDLQSSVAKKASFYAKQHTLLLLWSMDFPPVSALSSQVILPQRQVASDQEACSCIVFWFVVMTTVVIHLRDGCYVALFNPRLQGAA